MYSQLRLPGRSGLRWALLLALGAYLAFAAALAYAEGTPPVEPQLQDLATVLPELRRGGYVIHMRRGMTDVQGKGDAEGGDPARCSSSGAAKAVHRPATARESMTARMSSPL